jgi:uncharacterized protein YhfF
MWAAYRDTLAPHPAPPADYEAWGFGDSAAMADDLGELVRSGRKTATCSLLWQYEADGDPLPSVGEHSIILDGQGEPLCIIETVEVIVQPFNGMDASFAAAEGEGDGSLAYWRAVHWSFFGRQCDRLGLTPRPDMPLVCERFVVRFP